MNPPSLHTLALLTHLLSAVVWVGGMFFAHFALRPSAAEVLQPPQRIPLLVATLGRFFRIVAVCVVLILGSGFALLARYPMASLPLGWHLMLGFGIVMAAVFAYIHAVAYPRLRRHAGNAAWPLAAAALAVIRRLVAFNLAVGIGVIACAVLGRA